MRDDAPLAIEASGLVKSFGETRAVDGVDLSVRSGSVYGVLGPNGAGKTTTIRMLATLIAPDRGSARVLGHDIVAEAEQVRRAVSLTGQLASVDEDLSGRENLVLLARLLGLARAPARARAGELLEAFGLEAAAGRLVKHYSGGMRRRLDIAASIVVTPRLMFLDEPTSGLDPRSRNQVWAIIRALVAEGTTILLCTQYLEEADQLADRREAGLARLRAEELGPQGRGLGHGGGHVELAAVLNLGVEVGHVAVYPPEPLAQRQVTLGLELDQVAANLERAERWAPQCDRLGHGSSFARNGVAGNGASWRPVMRATASARWS